MNHTRWKSSTSFIFAGASAAIGLGNIWRFPYLVGENGGGAFVIIYLICVVVIGLPLLMAEMSLGRMGRGHPAHAFKTMAKQSSVSTQWRWAGAWLMITGFLVLSYYVVISGWVLDYIVQATSGALNHLTAASSQDVFKRQTGHLGFLVFYTSLVVLLAVGTLARGLQKGLERAVRFIFPLLVICMLVLLVYAIAYGAFGEACRYLFIYCEFPCDYVACVYGGTWPSIF